MAYKQREFTSGFDPNIISIGKKWNCSWLSYVAQDANMSNVVYFAGGGQRTFYGTNDYLTNTRLGGDTTNGFTLSYPDGSQDVYGFIVTNNSGAFQKAFMTARWNAQGQRILLNYANYSPNGPVVRLQNVVDGDGRTNFIYYTADAFSTNLISQVVDAFGRSSSLLYDANGHLTTITDVAGLSSSADRDRFSRSLYSVR